MIPTTLTNTPPPPPQSVGIGVFNQTSTSCNNCTLPSYTPALLGIASLILEGRDFITDDCIPQRTQNAQIGSDWPILNEFGRHSPELPSTSEVAYNEHTVVSNSNEVGAYLLCKINKSPDSGLYIDTATYSGSGSDSVASSLDKQQTRWSQKLSQLRQESPSTQSHEQIIAMETACVNRSSDAEYVKFPMDNAALNNPDMELSNDYEVVNRGALNRINSYNSLSVLPRSFNVDSDKGCNSHSFSTNTSGFSQESFMSSLQLLATNTCLKVGTSMYNTTYTTPSRSTVPKYEFRCNRANTSSFKNPYITGGMSEPSISSNSSTINAVKTTKPSSHFWHNVISPINENARTSTLTTTRKIVTAQSVSSGDDGDRGQSTKKLSTSKDEIYAQSHFEKVRKQYYNNNTPQEGPHCDQFLRKMGLIKAVDGRDIEEHYCDMSYVNVACTRWRAYSLKIEAMLSRGETICIEVYLGPVDHKILLEQWIIAIKDKQSSPTMTLPSLCSAIRSQLYFSQVSAWCDLIKKADKAIYETGRLIFTTPLNSAAGDLVTSTTTSLANAATNTINTGAAMSSITTPQFNQRRPKLNIFYRIKQFDGTASFKSKPNVHNFPSVNLTENFCVSVCLKSLPRFSGGIPPVIAYNDQSVAPIKNISTAGMTISKELKSALISDTALNQPIIINCDILEKNQAKLHSQQQKSPQIQPQQTFIDDISPMKSIMNNISRYNGNKIDNVDTVDDNSSRSIKFVTTTSVNEANIGDISNKEKLLLPPSRLFKSNEISNVLGDDNKSGDNVLNVRCINSTIDCGKKALLSSSCSYVIQNGNNGGDTSSTIDNYNILASHENLKHREKQLMKYRKRMFKRDKQQQQQHPHQQYCKINDNSTAVAMSTSRSLKPLKGQQQQCRSISLTSASATFEVDKALLPQLMDQSDDENHEEDVDGDEINSDADVTQLQQESVSKVIEEEMAITKITNQRRHQQQLQKRIPNSLNMNAQASTSNYNKEISNSLVRKITSAPVPVAAGVMSDNKIEMISTGTQTSAIYCYSCGNLKTLICTQCDKCVTKSIYDSGLSSIEMKLPPPAIFGNDRKTDIHNDSDVTYSTNYDTYNNGANNEIDLEMDSHCVNGSKGGSVHSSSGLGSIEIIHTSRNKAKLLLQAIQCTSKAANTAVAAAATVNAGPESPKASLVAMSVREYRKNKFYLKQCHQNNLTITNKSNNSDTNIRNNSSNDKNYNHSGSEREEIQTLPGVKGEKIIQNNYDDINTSATMITTTVTANGENDITATSNNKMMMGCQVCKRQKTQHNFFLPQQESPEQQITIESIIEGKDHHVIPTAAAIATSHTALNNNHNTAICEDDDNNKVQKEHAAIIDEECFETITKIEPLIKQCFVQTTTTTAITVVSTATKNSNILCPQEENEQQQRYYHKIPPPLTLKENNVFNDRNDNENKNNKHHFHHVKCDVMAQFKTPTNESITTGKSLTDIKSKSKQEPKSKQSHKHKSTALSLQSFLYRNIENNKSAENDASGNCMENRINQMQTETPIMANNFGNHSIVDTKIMNNNDSNNNNNESNNNCRRNLLKINLTPIFCNTSSMIPSSTSLLSLSIPSKSFMNGGREGNMISVVPKERINTETTIVNTEKRGVQNIIPRTNTPMPSRSTFTFDSPTSSTNTSSTSLTNLVISPTILQKSNSALTLPKLSHYLSVYTICNQHSRHLYDRPSLVSDEQYSDDDIDYLSTSSNTTSKTAILNKSVRNQRCTNMLFACKPLLGNLEESLLQKRLLPKLEVMGFRLLLGASGNFCPVQLTLSADAYFYELNGNTLSTPYLCEASLPRKGYTIPRFGTVQATLLNPMGTVVRMFVIPYDMRDMPALHQTFIRQRILVDNSGGDGDITNKLPVEIFTPASKITTIMRNNTNYSGNGDSAGVSCFNNDIKNMTINIRQQEQHRSRNCRNESNLGLYIPTKAMKSLRYSIHLRFQTSRSGRLMLHTDIRLLISRRTDRDTAASHTKGILESTNNDLIIDTVMPTNPKYSMRQLQQQDLANINKM